MKKYLENKVKPEISVIMPVYNTKEEYLRPAIESILAQTYENFEFIIIDDGSTEEVKKVERDYEDKRIIVIENKKNLGLSKTLNIGLRSARGKYIARMDSDDISTSDRLEIQYQYMQKHKDVIVAGGAAKILGSENVIGVFSNRKPEQIQIELLFNNIGLVHPTVMFRSSILKDNDLWYNEEAVTEDYELWTRCILYGKIVSIPKLLLYYRVHDGQITTEKKEKIIKYTNKVRISLLEKFSETFSEEEIREFVLLREFKSQTGNERLCRLLKKISEGAPAIYDKKILKRNLWVIWFIIARKSELRNKDNMLRYKITYNIFKPDYLWFAVRYKVFEKMYISILKKKLGGK